MKGGARNDEPAENYHLNLQLFEGLVLYMQRILSYLMSNGGTKFIGLNIRIF